MFGITLNLLTLGYFKYFNFGTDLLGINAWQVILPIGISFYIFHCISYLVDVYRGDTPPSPRLWDFAAFVALFPHLIAGPVLRYKDLALQFSQRTHSWEKFNEGALRFMIGFTKKVMIADTLAPLADGVFAHPNPTFAESWLGLLAYAAQLYFDFSGYSDMAVGLALMMGFRFIENFNHPYLSRSITEFWRRWHISLSTWLRDYLYIPLGGNRKGRLRTCVNLFLTMLLGGLWHGANVTFVFWGAWHGMLMVLERLFGELQARWLTLLCVLLGWVLFRSPDMEMALGFYQGLIGLHGLALTNDLRWQITPLMLATLGLAYLYIFLAPRLSAASALTLTGQLGALGIFLLALCKLIADSYTPFLYFQF